MFRMLIKIFRMLIKMFRTLIKMFRMLIKNLLLNIVYIICFPKENSIASELKMLVMLIKMFNVH